MKKIFNSISTRVSVVLLVAGSLVLASLVVIMQWIASGALREELLEDNNTLANFIMHNIDKSMLDYQRQLTVEAGKSTIVKAVINPEGSNYYIKDYLEEVSDNFPDSELFLYTFDGMAVLGQGPDVFREKLHAVLERVVEKNKPEIILDEASGGNAMIYFIVPVTYGEHAEGTLVTCVPFKSIFNRETWLVNVDSRINIIAEGSIGNLAETRERVDSDISSHSSSLLIPIDIVVEVPRDIIDDPLFNMELSMGIIGAVIILGAVLGLDNWVKRMVIRPILRLREGVIGIVEGGWQVIPEVEGEAEEIGVLVKAFNSMQSSLKERTAMLFQVEKMSSIGQLAAGVAHEINNPASFVISNLETLRRYVDGMLEMLEVCQKRVITAEYQADDFKLVVTELKEIQDRIDLAFIQEDVRDLIIETIDGMNRISKIVAGLKDFSHLDKGDELVECDINKIIDKAINIAWNELKYKCTIHKDYADLSKLFAYEGQLSQVILNLLVNASQAIKDKGNIYIRTFADESCAVIEIRDDGAGMSEDVIKVIFDPFFTTKPVGKGTGLGLHICQKIISEHRGSIEVESEVGVGTVFRIQLPLKYCVWYSI